MWLSGVLDACHSEKFCQAFSQARATGAPVIVLDLTGVTYLDCDGLRLIVEADADLHREGRRLVILVAPGRVQGIFQITQLNRRLELIDATVMAASRVPNRARPSC